MLPLGNPAPARSEAYDDFNFQAAAWTLSAHEGRPGHELQFTAMVERGVSLGARRCTRSTASTSKAGRCMPRPRWCRTSRSKAS